MTVTKQSDARVRARMAKTGERYLDATSSWKPKTDRGWMLRGGMQSDPANLTNVLAHLRGEGAKPSLSEAMALGIGGGLGAGYMLWDYQGPRPNILIGFRYRWSLHDWIELALTRLGAKFEVQTTGSASRAATALTEAVEAGYTPIVRPDRQDVSLYHLAPGADMRLARELVAATKRNGVVVYGIDGDRVCVDDRNLVPLTVDAGLLADARARLSSSKNHMVVVREAPPLPRPADAVRAGIADCVKHMRDKSATTALPAWGKWAKEAADTKAPRGWPQIYSGGKGLTTALSTIWEAVEPVGLTGGHLRGQYADFLDEAGPLLGKAQAKAAEAAAAFRAAAQAWHELAETALPADVPEFAKIRELTAQLAVQVTTGGDAAAGARGDTAKAVWQLIVDCDRKPPVDYDFSALGARIAATEKAEREAVQALADVVAK